MKSLILCAFFTLLTVTLIVIATWAVINHEIRLSMVAGQGIIYTLFASLTSYSKYSDDKSEIIYNASKNNL